MHGVAPGCPDEEYGQARFSTGWIFSCDLVWVVVTNECCRYTQPGEAGQE